MKGVQSETGFLYSAPFCIYIYIYIYSDSLIENWGEEEETYLLALYSNVNLIGFGGHECTGPLQPKPIKLPLSIG